MAAGAALGAGALPVPNPLFGLRVFGLPGRNVTAALALAYAGTGLVVLAWLGVARLLCRPGAPTVPRAQLARTALTWAVPLAVAPPLFSRDVYSYLAQGVMAARGLDPYRLGPAALGVDDPLVRSIPTMWRDTPTPYGPLFVLLERGVAQLTGGEVVPGVLAHRALALVGVAAVVWALPRLAARAGVDGDQALWLGAAHPLVLFHVISGAHNDGLMIGLALVGLELGLAAGPRLIDPRFLGGAALVVCGAAVKLPALLVLGFLGVACARARGGGTRGVAGVAAVLAAVAAVVLALAAWPLPDGWGWVSTLGVPGSSIAWMSPTTDLGLLGGLLSILAGLGDHTTAVLALTRGVGLATAAGCCVVLLVATLRDRVDPVAGVAAGVAAVVLLGPVVQPWYLLWIAVPLAATAVRLRWSAAAAAAAVLAVPSGADFFFRSYQLPLAIAGACAVFAACLLAARRIRPGARPRFPARPVGIAGPWRSDTSWPARRSDLRRSSGRRYGPRRWGFDFVEMSDHFHPWLDDQGHSSFTWAVLGAIAARTERIGLVTGVTCPTIRYHPAVIAQAAATLALISDDRFTLGVGSGERLNEHVVGRGFPAVRVRHEMFREALEIIRLLWRGGYRSYDGRHLQLEDARVFDLPERLPEIAVAASGPASARIAAELGDGLFATDPDADLVAHYRKAGGHGPGYAEAPLAWAPDERTAAEAALATNRWGVTGWKVMSELPNPVNFAAATTTVRAEDMAGQFACGPDPERHIEVVRPFVDAGFDRIVLMNAGPDPDGFLDFFRDELAGRVRTLTPAGGTA